MAANSASSVPPVLINEWMAANSRTLAESADGGFNDWFELYNPGSTLADLAGYSLSDSAAEPRKFVIPQGFLIPPQGFLLVWADDHPERNQPGQALHVPFKLSADGEMILLSGPDGTRLDTVTFGPQQQDISEGRWPDGAAGPFRRFALPTPASANVWQFELRLSGGPPTGEGGFGLSWASSVGERFRLQYKNDLNEPAWLNLGDEIVAVGGETQVPLPLLDRTPHRFYRVILAL